MAKSLAQIQAEARARAAQIQSRARAAARANQLRMEQRIRSLTCGGERPLTPAEIRQLARESANFLRSRIR